MKEIKLTPTKPLSKKAKEKLIKRYENSKKLDTPTDAKNALAPVFIPPFRVGRKQMRAVLDAKGVEVVIFPKGLESYAKEYADFLNSTRQ